MELEDIQAQICELTPLQGIAFAVALCERMFPIYPAFSKARRWGKPEPLRKGIDLCWSVVLGGLVKASAAERMIERIAKVTPDSDDFGDFDATLAANAAISAITCLKILAEYDSDKVASISEYSRDSMDAFLSEIFQEEASDIETISNHAAFEKWAKESPQMHKEIASQQALLDQIKSKSQIDHTAVNTLKEIALDGSIDPTESAVFPPDRMRAWRESAG